MGRSTSECASKEQRAENMSDGSEQYVISQQSDNGRIVMLYGEVNELSIASTIAQLLSLANQSATKPVHLVISTYGGSLDDMFCLYDTVKFLPCPVHTVALGKVMSAGILLLASGHKGNRLIGNSARLMMHSLSGGVAGNVFEVLNETEEMKRLQNLMVSALEHETKMSQKQIENIMGNKLDRYILPEEAVKLGIVDKIIGK
jgi:ATP-dependent Clp protease protease subunit